MYYSFKNHIKTISLHGSVYNNVYSSRTERQMRDICDIKSFAYDDIIQFPIKDALDKLIFKPIGRSRKYKS